MNNLPIHLQVKLQTLVDRLNHLGNGLNKTKAKWLRSQLQYPSKQQPIEKYIAMHYTAQLDSQLIKIDKFNQYCNSPMHGSPHGKKS
tara:strand:- start:642 stop:902 length:261 start_codon:yes stop_codon:yes gene_type:complete